MPLADGAYDRGMRPRTSPAYWPRRILLAVGIVSVAVIVLGELLPPVSVTFGATTMTLGPIFIDGSLAGRVGAAVVVVPVIGLLCMIRVFRGPRDEPSPWRYRDR
jgi:hypothetical protein